MLKLLAEPLFPPPIILSRTRYNLIKHSEENKKVYIPLAKKRLIAGRSSRKTGFSRRTVSKWELNQSLPDVFQAKRLARLYRSDLDERHFSAAEQKGIAAAVDGVSEQIRQKTDWTKMRGRKYPVTLPYREIADSLRYAAGLKAMPADLKKTYGYSDTDAVLVLKDILSKAWKS